MADKKRAANEQANNDEELSDEQLHAVAGGEERQVPPDLINKPTYDPDGNPSDPGQIHPF